MSNQPRTRAELYERIRATSKDEVILEEMLRLGFWTKDRQVPAELAGDVERSAQIERELAALRAQLSELSNLTQRRKALLRERLLASRQKQQETKERNERERAERASLWKQRKAREILYLGAGVSGGLSAHEANDEKLRAQGLPGFADSEALARAMGITIGELRFLTFSRVVSRTSHYARFTMPKKSGGERLISAPMPKLKAAQRWVLDNILTKCALHPAAHGFRAERSIVTNAEPHVGAAVVVNLDLRDFFPTIVYRRVRGVFRAMGYDDATATVLALLCTEPDVDEVLLDGERYFVAQGERRLPQGAPTSPAITNLLCRSLDRRLCAIATRLGFVYTRYADDLTFSAPRGAATKPDTGKLLRQVRWTVAQEGLVVHPTKTRILRRSRRQEVTGVVVNEKLSVDRDTLRRFRALVFQLEKDGPSGKRWGESSDVLSGAMGYANFVAMVSPEKGAPLRERMLAVMAKWRPSPLRAPKPTATSTSAAPPAASSASAPDAPPTSQPEPSPTKKKWWKLFLAAWSRPPALRPLTSERGAMATTEVSARKVALVTGASKGIGLAIAQALSSAGFAVVGCARERTSLDAAFISLREQGAVVMTAACDVAEEAQVEQLFADILARFGRLDVLVNNAGVFEKTPIEQMTAAQWDRVMSINTRGVFLCSRAAFRTMREGGDIINISSLGGVKNIEKFVGTSAYVASKYAVAGLTEALAAEGKTRGIRVKAISPGAVDTELLKSSGNGLTAGISASELAQIVAFLVSDAARALSGTNLEIFSNA